MRRSGGTVFLAILSIGFAAIPQTGLPRPQAEAVLRDVGQAESALRSSSKAEYGGMQDVIQSARWTDSGISRDPNLPVVLVDASTATVLDYTLRAARSADGQHFDVSLTVTQLRGCNPGWFLDDRSRMYLGAPFGCGTDAPTAARLSREDGQRTIRTVIAVELEINGRDRKGFGDLGALLHAAQTRLTISALDDTSATTADYTLRIALSDDRAHYLASLTPSEVKGCTGVGWFADERNIIYVGHPVC
jgi:hypothetical protein